MGHLNHSFEVVIICDFFNRQVTEAIPKRLFDQANLLRKTLYQRSVQVPKIGTKQVFLAINPTPGGVKPYSSTSSSSGAGAVAGGGAASKQVRDTSLVSIVVWSVVLTLLSSRPPPANLSRTRCRSW